MQREHTYVSGAVTNTWTRGAGYEFMEYMGEGRRIPTVDDTGRSRWNPVSMWGAHGWDLGSWPLVIIFVAIRPAVHGQALNTVTEDKDLEYGLLVYVEGDLDIRWFDTVEERDEQIDIQFAYHCWVYDLKRFADAIDEMPSVFRGRYRSERGDEVVPDEFKEEAS